MRVRGIVAALRLSMRRTTLASRGTTSPTGLAASLAMAALAAASFVSLCLHLLIRRIIV